eukprot:GHVS01100267.1.p1 GENE.GHVS01100267.1~~GHVS01100267.1.p1  ORF type:complete len:631 (-),score=42.68 GHVS01100267.1:145-2037(-)
MSSRRSSMGNDKPDGPYSRGRIKVLLGVGGLNLSNEEGKQSTAELSYSTPPFGPIGGVKEGAQVGANRLTCCMPRMQGSTLSKMFLFFLFLFTGVHCDQHAIPVTDTDVEYRLAIRYGIPLLNGKVAAHFFPNTEFKGNYNLESVTARVKDLQKLSKSLTPAEGWEKKENETVQGATAGGSSASELTTKDKEDVLALVKKVGNCGNIMLTPEDNAEKLMNRVEEIMNVAKTEVNDVTIWLDRCGANCRREYHKRYYAKDGGLLNRDENVGWEYKYILLPDEMVSCGVRTPGDENEGYHISGVCEKVESDTNTSFKGLTLWRVDANFVSEYTEIGFAKANEGELTYYKGCPFTEPYLTGAMLDEDSWKYAWSRIVHTQSQSKVLHNIRFNISHPATDIKSALEDGLISYNSVDYALEDVLISYSHPENLFGSFVRLLTNNYLWNNEKLRYSKLDLFSVEECAITIQLGKGEGDTVTWHDAVTIPHLADYINSGVSPVTVWFYPGAPPTIAARIISVSFEQLDKIPTTITVSCHGKETWEKPQLQFEVVLYDSKGFRGFYVPVWDGLSLGQIKIVTKTNEVESTSVVVGWEQVMRKEWRKTQRRDPDVYGEMVTTRGGKKQYRYTFRINEGH